ncbi:MAG: hypothetical protein AAFX39_14600 [Pseudomonadota bacterium]
MSAAAVIAAFGPALAQSDQGSDRPDEDGRYLLQRTDDGFFRVDRETGEASVCRERSVGWTCQLVPDDREALEDEISRLAEENQDLRRLLARLEDEGASTGGDSEIAPEADAPPSSDNGIPTDEELDQVMDTFEQIMRRFFDMARDLQQDLDQLPQ